MVSVYGSDKLTVDVQTLDMNLSQSLHTAITYVVQSPDQGFEES